VRTVRMAILALFALAALTSALRAASVQELVRLKGQGESVLQGFGLVIGLPGTGDSGEDLLVARPLAQLLKAQGAPIESFEELSESRSVAVVVVTCTIPPEGARRDDKFDVTVSAINNPASLSGGQLFLTPLRGPYASQGVFAIAEGPIVIEGTNQARGLVRGGARMIEDIAMETVGRDGRVALMITPSKAGWTTAQLLASVINDHRVGLDRSAARIAMAVDERTVEVLIPDAERADPAAFLADILSVRFDPSLLTLPAKVVVNEREGVIVVTGEVEISPVVITHKDLVITTITPPVEPTPEFPQAEEARWTSLETNAGAAEAARLEDLLRAFKALDVSVDDQIAILTQLHASGRLHAELVVR